MSNTIEIVIPDIGDAEEVEVVEILVKAGDSVAIDDPLITIESDKASLDIPSTASGVIIHVAVNTGDKVRMGSVVLTLESAPASGADATPAVLAATPVIADTITPVSSNDNGAARLTQPSTREPNQERSVDIAIPDIGTDDAVEIIEIHVEVGQAVAVDDPIVTLESDKASMDVPVTIAGSVTAIHVAIGDTVNQGDRLVTLVAEGESHGSDALAPVVSEPTTKAPRPESHASDRRTSPATPVPGTDAAHDRRGKLSKNPHASPSVRRFARELGADLGLITGTGRKGRIQKEDVQAFIKSALSSSASAGGMNSGGIPTVPVIDFSKFGEIESVRLSRIKRLSGPHLQRAWLNAPHVTHHDDADVTDLENFRQSMKDEVAKQGIKLTPLVFVMKAVVATLKEFPQFNASLDGSGENLIYKKYFNIGIAVDTPQGLVVPVIREVDKKGYIELAQELAEVSSRAREGALKPQDIQGGTFSISSLGGIGGSAFTPIINVPEVAILGVARSRMTPVWDGDEFVPKLMLPLDLSYDHRVVDGAEAARFVSFLVDGLGDIRRLSM